VKRRTGAPGTTVLQRGPLQYGKRLYLSEVVAEQSIRAIAFLSIAFILAIFFYVFREATYAFTGEEETPAVVQSAAADGDADLRPESYGGEASSADTPDVRPESYTPESYGPAAEGDDALASGRAASLSLESSGNNDPVRVADLVTPNDTIEGIPSYIWQPIGHVPKYSFVPLAVGALKVTLIGLLFAAPIAILAAIFTTAFAPRWMREIMKPAIEILAGFPSVVIGFFCLMTVATIAQELTGSTYRLNSFVGGIGMALAVIPIIFTVTEDAFAAVPKYMKEASLALGASRWQTAWRVVLPAATPGVFAALILGFGRAFGETMIALMATGNAALVSGDIFESVRTMAATIGAEMAEVEFRSVHYGVLFLIGAVLFVVTFSLNAIAEFYVRKRLLKKFQGN
jgi:phosphate transport system permease protein